MKKTKKILSVIIMVILIILTLTACSTETGSGIGQTIEITDMTGATSSVPVSIDRIIVLTPGDCETVFALGEGDKIVGRGTYCDKPSGVEDIEEVSSGSEMNLEQLLSLDPDVIFVNSMGETLECIDKLRDNGIAVIETSASSIDETYEAITLTGKVLGKEKEAEDIIASMKQSFNDIAASVSESTGKTVYFEISPLEYGLYAAGTGTFMNEIAELLGLENIFADTEGWPAVSEEEIINRNPDYIVSIGSTGSEAGSVEEICSRDGWQSIQAVKDSKVLFLTDNSLSRPSPELVNGAQQLADFINGK